MNDNKPIYKPQRPYTEDINDLVEKGRGPDKQPRKKRGEGHHIEVDHEAESKAKFDAAVEADKKNNPKYYDKNHPEYKHRSGIKIR